MQKSLKFRILILIFPYLHITFALCDLGEMNYFLGIEVTRLDDILHNVLKTGPNKLV